MNRKKPAASAGMRVHRGWGALSAEEKRRWREKRDQEAQLLTDEVTVSILSLIDMKQTKGGMGWAENWVAPQNIIYGRRYSGVNAVALIAQTRKRGQTDCRFLTWNALRKLKDESGRRAQLREGAEPYLVMSPRRGPDRKLKEGADLKQYDPERLERRADGMWLLGRLYFSTIRVYSIADTTAKVPPLSVPAYSDFRENDFLDRFFEACGVQVQHIPGSGAFFCHSDGTIHMPPKELFESSEMYYATLLHEFYHWTGVPERENRLKEAAPFGSEEYAKEELRAELFSAVTSVMFGLGGTLPRAAGYINLWNRTLQDNSKEILAMAAQAQRMAGAIYDVADGARPRPEWMRGMDFSDVPAPVLQARAEGQAEEDRWREEMGIESPEAWKEMEEGRNTARNTEEKTQEGSAVREDEGSLPRP